MAGGALLAPAYGTSGRERASYYACRAVTRASLLGELISRRPWQSVSLETNDAEEWVKPR